jgi:F0F1-type ATP synthase alpha subunit
MTEALKQRIYKPLSFVEEYISLYAVIKGFYASMAVEDILDFERYLLKDIHLNHFDLFDKIEQADKELSAATLKCLDDVIKESIISFMEDKEAK